MTWLESLADYFGVTVIPRGYVRGVIDGYVVGDAMRYVTADTLTERVVPIEARVFPAPKPPAPGLYTPTRGKAAERYLLHADDKHVRYAGEQPGVVEITRGGWDLWVRRHRARVESEKVQIMEEISGN